MGKSPAWPSFSPWGCKLLSSSSIPLVPSCLFSGLNLVLFLLNSPFSPKPALSKVLSYDPSLLRFLFPSKEASFFMTFDPLPQPSI